MFDTNSLVMPDQIEYLLKNVQTHHYRFINELIQKRYGPDKQIVGCEIGTREGFMTSILLVSNPNLKMYAIDITNNELQLFNVNHDYIKRLTFINKYSDEAVTDVANSLDFLFIDGGRHDGQLKRDALNYGPKVNKGGFIFGFKEGAWEKIWGNDGIRHVWPENVVHEDILSVFGKEDLNLDNEWLWIKYV
jgi:hypothetical protein